MVNEAVKVNIELDRVRRGRENQCSEVLKVIHTQSLSHQRNSADIEAFVEDTQALKKEIKELELYKLRSESVIVHTEQENEKVRNAHVKSYF